MDLPVPDIVRDMDSSVRWAALLLTVSLLFSAVILRAVAGSGRASATLNKPVSASGGRRARGNPTVCAPRRAHGWRQDVLLQPGELQAPEGHAAVSGVAETRLSGADAAM